MQNRKIDDDIEIKGKKKIYSLVFMITKKVILIKI